MIRETPSWHQSDRLFPHRGNDQSLGLKVGPEDLAPDRNSLNRLSGKGPGPEGPTPRRRKDGWRRCAGPEGGMRETGVRALSPRESSLQSQDMRPRLREESAWAGCARGSLQQCALGTVLPKASQPRTPVTWGPGAAARTLGSAPGASSTALPSMQRIQQHRRLPQLDSPAKAPGHLLG